VAEFAFDLAYTYIFSPREGTRAAQMTEEFVSDALVAERFGRLKEVLDRSALLHHRARVGRTEEVLVEGPSRRNDQMISGRTRQGKLIHFPVTQTPMRAGSLAQVSVVHGAPYHLLGTEVALLRGPKHKTRIPITIS
jgi:tRNA-2-methylthio-N6-dimethylallyladenosine synthase